jgi:hypothetical protein
MSVTLIAFGRRGYAAAAANMVASLRHYGYNGRINLHVGAPLLPHIPDYTTTQCEMHVLPEEFTKDAGWCKVNLPSIITEPTLYLDVDGIALKDMTPLIAELQADGRPYITEVMGTGKDGDKIGYFEWATTKKVRYMEGFGPEATYYGIQSSWAYLVPSETLRTIGGIMRGSWRQWKPADLKHTWGGTMPDELFWSIACTTMDYDPTWGKAVAFFGQGFHPLAEVNAKHYIMTLHGSGKGHGTVPPRYVEHYNHILKAVYRRLGMHNPNPASVIRKDKWVDHKN